jgi:hypothetical protein
MAAARSRIAVVVAALGVFVAACLVGDHGAARAAVGQATGPLVGSPSAGAAILAAHDLAPGDVQVGEVTVTNAGDQAGAFSLGAESVSYSGVGLATMLDLAVEDVTPGRARTVVFVGKLGSLSNVALGTMAQGEEHRYRFTISLPLSAGDAYQAASTATTFVWRTSAATAAPTTTSPPAATPTPTAAKPATPTPTAAKPATAAPRATLSATARQSAAKGTVDAWIACQAACKAVLSGTAVDGSTTLPLRTVRRTLSTPGRVRLRVALPERARAALADHRALAVRLRLKATMGTRVVVARRTVRVAHR